MELTWFCVALLLCPRGTTQELRGRGGYDEMWRKVSELLLFPLYLHKIVLPEVKPKGFDPADLRKIAMDSRAI